MITLVTLGYLAVAIAAVFAVLKIAASLKQRSKEGRKIWVKRSRSDRRQRKAQVQSNRRHESRREEDLANDFLRGSGGTDAQR